MSFVARCPFCSVKFRLPETALAGMMECMRCHSFFTVVPEENASSRKLSQAYLAPSLKKARLWEPGSAPAAASGDSHATLRDWSKTSETFPQDRPASKLWLNPWGVVGLLLGGMGLLAASFPWVRNLTIPLSALGCLLGGMGIFTSELKTWKMLLIPAIAALFGFGLLLVALCWPTLLGDNYARVDQEILTDSSTPKLIGRDGKPQIPAGSANQDWLDASQGDIHWGNVRVAVRGLSIGPVALGGPGGSGVSKKHYVQVRLRLTNIGSSAPLTYQSWGGRGLNPSDHPATLTDTQGKNYSSCNHQLGRPIKGHTPEAMLKPGQQVEDLLVFDGPTKNVEFYRLQLPTGAWGGAGVLRLHLPLKLLQK